jgi:ABC-2 type transport system ATP-binding protein
VARALNGRHWDQRRAERRLAALDIPSRRKVGKLSAGQQAQVALTIAVARRPEFLVLDEPLAPLDPLARHEFLASVMETVAEDGTSVLFSSHVIGELERVADYLVVLARGHVQVAGDVETLLAGHQVLTGPTAGTGTIAARFDVVHAERGSAQAHLVVRRGTTARPPEGWQAHPVTLEELMLAYLREPQASALPGPEPLAAGAVTGLTS